jgi:hypothetical protein
VVIEEQPAVDALGGQRLLYGFQIHRGSLARSLTVAVRKAAPNRAR